MNVSIRHLGPLLDELIKDGKRVRLTVSGSSMFPFIRDGDVVEIEGLNSKIRVGDVLLVRKNEETYVLHRVVKIEKDKFFLRGDYSSCLEGPFRKEDVVARAVIRYCGGKIYDLSRGCYRLAGMVWARTFPINLYTIRLLGFLRRVFRKLVPRFVFSNEGKG
jgi:hypothetical protein